MHKMLVLCVAAIVSQSQASVDARAVRATIEVLKYRRTVLRDTMALNVCEVSSLFESSGVVADLSGERVRPITVGECAAGEPIRSFKSGIQLRGIEYRGDTAVAYTVWFRPAKIETARYLVFPMSNNPTVIDYRIAWTEER